MKTSLTYGFIMALASSLLSLGFFFAGFHDDVSKVQVAQNLGLALGIVIAGVCMVLGMQEKRTLTPADANWGYGSAVGTGVMIGLFGALLSSIYTYCYFSFINPNMSEIIYQLQVVKMEARGMSSAQIERAEPMIRKWMNPVIMTVSSLVVIFITNVALALLAAIFVKNRPVATTASAA